MNKAFNSVLNGNKDEAMSDLNLSQSCIEVSTLFYTVSENAGALYTRFVEGEQRVAEEGARISQRCAEIPKQKGTLPKQ